MLAINNSDSKTIATSFFNFEKPLYFSKAKKYSIEGILKNVPSIWEFLPTNSDTAKNSTSEDIFSELDNKYGEFSEIVFSGLATKEEIDISTKKKIELMEPETDLPIENAVRILKGLPLPKDAKKFIEKINNSIEEYQQEEGVSKISVGSFFRTINLIPFLYKFNPDFDFDFENGFVNLTKREGNYVLSLVVCEKNEVLFSLSEELQGLVKTSGKVTTLNKKDMIKIKKLFYLVGT